MKLASNELQKRSRLALAGGLSREERRAEEDRKDDCGLGPAGSPAPGRVGAGLGYQRSCAGASFG